MTLEKTKIRHSFSVRLTIYIFLLVSFVFMWALAHYYISACRQVKKDAMENAQIVLSNTQQEIGKVLRGTELIAENMSWQIPQLIKHRDSAFSITQQVLHSNSFVCGCALAFRPDYFKDRKYFSPYAYRKEGKIYSKQLATESYRYSEQKWYREALLKNSGVWSAPYEDQLGGEQWMVTYSLPLEDEHGDFYAVLTVDLSLETLEKFVHKMNPFPHSYSLVIDAEGNYVVRPNDLSLARKNLFASAENVQKDDLKNLAKNMTSGKNGQVRISREEEDYIVFFAPVENWDWSVAVSHRERDIFQDIQKMTRDFLIEVLLGVLLLAMVCYWVIHKMTAPLKQLTKSAVQVASGDFSAHLPKPKGKDEMAVLCRSFDFMQNSLVNYIEKLKQTTIERERIESDLRIAGEIQRKMVPIAFPTYPHSPNLDVAALLVPAKAVGGDFYQFLMKDDCFYFIVGDVSGKGVPAALIMSALCRMFRMVAHALLSPAEIVTTINSALVDCNETNMFATAFVGALHLSTGRLEYCNAGHNATILMPMIGKPQWLQVESNLPLGLFEGFTYKGQEIKLCPADALLLYTDGVTEAENEKRELFSDERLLTVAEDLSKETSQNAVNHLYECIQLHANGAVQSDDITIFCMNYNPKSKAAYGTCLETQK